MNSEEKRGKNPEAVAGDKVWLNIQCFNIKRRLPKSGRGGPRFCLDTNYKAASQSHCRLLGACRFGRRLRATMSLGRLILIYKVWLHIPTRSITALGGRQSRLRKCSQYDQDEFVYFELIRRIEKVEVIEGLRLLRRQESTD